MALFTTEEVVNFYSAEESKGSQERSIEIPVTDEWLVQFERVQAQWEELQLQLLSAYTDTQKGELCRKRSKSGVSPSAP